MSVRVTVGHRLPPVRLEFAAPEFYEAAHRKLRVEENEDTGRVYVLKGDAIVAVGHIEEGGR